MILSDKDIKKAIKEKRRQMHDAADNLDFETAALLRDEISKLERDLATKKAKKKIKESNVSDEEKNAAV